MPTCISTVPTKTSKWLAWSATNSYVLEEQLSARSSAFRLRYEIVPPAMMPCRNVAIDQIMYSNLGIKLDTHLNCPKKTLSSVSLRYDLEKAYNKTDLMKCLNCDGNQFEEKTCRFTPEIKEEEVEVIAPAMVCSHCGDYLMDSEQMSHLMKMAADAYRKKRSKID